MAVSRYSRLFVFGLPVHVYMHAKFVSTISYKLIIVILQT